MEDKLRVPLLAIIVIAYVAFGSAYAIRTPTWETPDEPAHYNYIRNLAEHLQLPVLQAGDYDQDYLERLKASKFPPSLSVDSVRYESWQPPAYHALSVPLFWATRSLSLARQVIVLRLFSVLLGATLLLVAYAAVRTIFPKDSLLPLAVPAFIATLPQHVAMTAAVNNDTLGELVLSLILLVLVRLISETYATSPLPSPQGRGSTYSLLPFSRRSNEEVTALTHCGRIEAATIVLGVLLGVALLTKTTAYIVLGLIPLGLVFREYIVSGLHVRIAPLVRQLAVIYGIGLLLSGWWFVRNAVVYGNLDIFGWQRHGIVVEGQPLTGAFDVKYAEFLVTGTFKSFWAQFGWMGVLADDRTYTLLGVLTVAALAGLTLFVVQSLWHSGSLTKVQQLSLLLMGTTIVLVLGIMVIYNFRFIQTQGRYLFPAIVPIAIFFSLGLREIIAERYRYLFFGSLYLVLLALDYISLTRFIIPQLTR